MQRSYIVNVSRVETSPSPNYAGGVFVAACVITAGADERSFLQCKWGLGYRAATRAGHSSVGGVNENDSSFRGLRHRNQNLLGHADRAIGGFLGHRGFSQKLRSEVLYGNPTESGNDPARPLEGAVLPLPGNGQVNAGDTEFGRKVSLGIAFGARQFALRFLERLRVSLYLVATRQVEIWIGRRGDLRDAPINSNGLIGWRKFFVLAASHKRNVPMAFAVATDDTRPGVARQLATPNDRNRNSASKAELFVFKSKSIPGIFKGWLGKLAALELGKPFIELPERLLMSVAPFSNRLLLDDTGTSAKPFIFSPPCSQLLSHSIVCGWLMINAIFMRLIGCAPRLNALIPHPSSAVPFHFQASQRNSARTQTVVIPDDGLVIAHG